MRFLSGALALAPLFATSIASAQAPGEAEAAPVAPAPVASPCGCTAPAHESVMANRWSIGLSLGSASLAPQSSPDAKTDFSIGELSIRWRAIEQMEVELSMAGGKERLADGTDGTRELSSVTIGARYRFRPEAAWGWFLMGGIGATSVTQQGATDQQKNDASHPHFQLGGGLERRFHHFAIQAELRLTAVSDQSTNSNNNTKDMPVAGTLMSSPPSTTTSGPAEKQSGGQATIGLSYYF